MCGAPPRAIFSLDAKSQKWRPPARASRGGSAHPRGPREFFEQFFLSGDLAKEAMARLQGLIHDSVAKQFAQRRDALVADAIRSLV